MQSDELIFNVVQLIQTYFIRLTIIVSLTFFLFHKIIVTLQFQCIIYYFLLLLYIYLLNFIQL